MAQTTRQSSLLVQQDWTKIYQSFTNADFTSYDFETLRNTMINYLQTYYPETFNDFIESSEYLALIDMIAFLGQSLAFRTDLNARENFIDTAQRRDSILKLARMLSYNPNRNTAASGLLKIDTIKTTESVYDSNGINLANTTVHWNDLTNDNWLEQFTAIFNASLVSTEQIGKPGNSQLINNIQTDEYSVNLNTNTIPVAGFTASIQGTPTAFEVVSATSVGKTYIYEDDPTKTGQFNILYRNDNNGNGSNNTGFFLFFKQGTLNVTNFNIANAIPNNFVNITTNNITDSDQWLYQLNVNNVPTTLWTQVPALPGINVIFNNLTEKNLYQVNSLTNDQVNLVFGDGSFANIPQGAFAFYYRTGNGLTYTINPDDLSLVSVALNYISSANTIETLSIGASLKYTVTNSSETPSTLSIKSLAPQQYYTQNRMITGEDYDIFPLTTFSSVQKVTAINRTSSGVSLYLDAIDPTGTYTATNIFCDDGIITANNSVSSTTFNFLTTNDIYNAIYNDIIPIISSPELQNYYYSTYSRFSSPVANIAFSQYTTTTRSSSGYLQLSSVTQQIGSGISTNLQYVAPGALLQFTAPTGHYFDSQHVLQSGNLTGTGSSTSFYAAVTNVVSNGDPYTPSLVTFGTVVPSGAILSDYTLTGAKAIIPAYKNDLSSSLITTLITQIQSEVNFGLYYDQSNQIWANIPPSMIGTASNWLLNFTYTNGLYNISYRSIVYSFASAGETEFYFDPNTNVYDSTTGLTITDTIKILKINSAPSSSVPIGQDIIWNVYNSVVEPDGFVDQTQVLIQFPQTQVMGVPDNPDLYTLVSGSSSSRHNLYFQYQHNAPARSRIDPTPVNIIDLYILTAAYSSDYIAWLQDLTGTVVEPTPPTSSSLEIAYNSLNNYKAISDTIIYNPAQFKPLFGSKAAPNLQANFQVVINPASNISNNEMSIQIISAINDYFDVNNWDFGDTFYFSELAAYLHSTLAPNLASIVIVPVNPNLVFGNYFQVNSEPWEIITSAATVNNIQIVPAITSAGLNLGNTLVGTY
jgi:hypothetical protein